MILTGVLNCSIMKKLWWKVVIMSIYVNQKMLLRLFVNFFKDRYGKAWWCQQILISKQHQNFNYMTYFCIFIFNFFCLSPCYPSANWGYCNHVVRRWQSVTVNTACEDHLALPLLIRFNLGFQDSFSVHLRWILLNLGNVWVKRWFY